MRCIVWIALIVAAAAMDGLAAAQSETPTDGQAPAAATQAPESPSAAPVQEPQPSIPSAAPAQTAPASPSTPAPHRIRFSFKGASFQQVIDFFSRQTGLPVIWKTPAPDGTLDYVSPGEYELAEALQVLNVILQSKGVMLRVDDQKLHLQKLEAMQKEDIPTYVGKIPESVTSDQIVTVVVPLKTALAKGMAEKLASMVASYGAVTAMEQQNALVITETAANARRIQTIIEQLDKDDPEGAVQIFPIRHAKAPAMMTSLNALLSQRVEKYVINQKGEQVKIEENQMPGLQISADERTNSIIARGVQARIDKLREAIALLDVPAAGEGRSMTTITLSRTAPADAAIKLNALYAKIAEKDRPTVLPLDDAGKVTIVGDEAAVQQGTLLLNELEGGLIPSANSQPEPVVSVIALERATPQNVIAAVTSLLNKRQQIGTKVIAGADGKSLIIAGIPADVDAVKALVPVLDRHAVIDRQVRLVRITTENAQKVFDQAQAVFDQQKQPGDAQMELSANLDSESRVVTLIGPNKAIEAFSSALRQIETNIIIDREVRRIALGSVTPSEILAQLNGLSQQLLQPRDGSAFVAPVFSAIDQSNSLLVTATPQQFDALKPIIEGLDVPSTGTDLGGQSPPLRILQLRIADAGSLANVLTAKYGQRSAMERKNRPVNIAADPQTNSLLVMAHPDVLPEIQKMVEELNTTERMDLEAREIKIYPLKVARAAELARTIDEMFPQPPVPVDVRGRPQPQFQKPRPVVVRADAQTNSLIISALPGMLNLTGEMISQLDVDPAQAINQSMPMRIFQLRIADASSLANALTARYNQRSVLEQKNKPANITADPQTNSLLVTAHPDLLPEIQAMVDELNTTERVDAEAREVKIYPLKVARAEELAKTIDEMFPMPPVPVDVRGRPQPQFQKPRPVVVRADPQTNSLIIAALPGMLSLTGEMISQLDVDPAQMSGAAARSLRVLAIENADAAQLAQNLDAMFSAPGQVEVRPTIRADATSNTLLIRSTDAQFKTIEQVVTQVDKATIVSTRQVRMIAVDPAKADAEEIARTLQRLIDRTSGTGAGGTSKVEVISLEELIKRREAEKTQPPKATSSLRRFTTEDTEVTGMGFGGSSLHLILFSSVTSVISVVNQQAEEPQTTIAVDKASNSLIILGSPRALERIAALAKQLQDQIPTAPGTIRYVTLPDAVDVQATTNLLQQAMSKITPAAGQPGDLTRRVAIIPDPAGNALVIAANDMDFAVVTDLLAALARPAAADLPIHTITLQRAEASAVATAVQKFFDDRAKLNPRNRTGAQRPQRMAIMAIENGNTLLVSAPDEDFTQVEQLVKQFDTVEANTGLTFRVFNLKHAKATEIERNLQSLVNDLIWGQGDVLFYPWMPQNQNKKKDTVSVRADPRLNALIVTGRGDKFDVVEKMIEILDAPPPQGGNRIVRLYRLKHAQLQMVADIVSETFNKGRQRRPWETPDPTAIGVRTDETANVLIVSANEKEHAEIKALITGIDEQLAVSGGGGGDPTAPPVQTHIIPVKFARASELAQTLTRFMTDRARAQNLPRPQATVIASDSANTLIVAAGQSELATIQDLLTQLDQPDVTGDRVVEIIALQQGKADDITRMLREQFARRMPGAAAGAGVILTSDSRTNSIIINAPQQEFAQAKALIERLDAPSDSDETIIRTYALKGAQADQAVRVLSQTLQLDARGQTPAPGTGTTIKLEDATGKPVEVKARIVSDKRSNSLIVTATPESFPVIETLIRKLDDVPAATPQEYHIVSLKYAMADDLAQTLAQVTRSPATDGELAPRINASRLENKLIIAATPDQYKHIDQIIRQIDQPSDEQRVTDFVPLKFAQAQKLQEALSVFYGQMAIEADTPSKKSVRIVADPATNSLVISAEKSEWEGIRSMLTRLDSAEYDSSLQLKVLPLVYADSQSVARAINDAFQSTMQRPVRGGQNQQRNQFNFPGMDFMQQGFGTLLVQADEWVRASAEPQTNSVIVTASRQNMAKVEQILKQLDVADYAKLPAPRLIPVSGGSDPVALAASLTQLYQQSRPGGSGSGGSAYPPVSIVGNASANSLIVRAEKEDFEQIKALSDALQQQASSNGLTVHILKLNAVPAGRIATALNEAFQAKAKQANQPLSIRVDPTGNSLIIASTGPLFDEIKASATQLDSMAPAGGQGVFIIDLKNIPPETAKNVIETIGLDKPQPVDSISKLVSEPIKVSLIPGRNAIAVLAAPADRDTIVGLLKALDSDPTMAEAQMRVIRLKHAQATALAGIFTQVLKPGDQQADTPLAKAIREQIRRLAVAEVGGAPGSRPTSLALDLTKPVRLIPEPLGNALIVSSTKDNLDAMEQLVAMFDQLPITDAVTVQIFPLQNISAEQFSRILKDIFTQGKQLGKTTLTNVPGIPEGAVGKALLDEVAMSTDERTNSVIVAGTEDAIALVEVLSKRIDSDVAQGWVEPRVVPLRFADAGDLAQTLQSILVDDVKNLPQSSPIQRQIARLRMARIKPGGATSAPGTGSVLESDVFTPMTRLIIRPEPQMNAIILVGTPANIEVVSELVAMLDIESASPANSVRIYPVENASAAKLATTIKQLFDGQVQSKVLRPEDRVNVQSDERTNALIVATSSRSFAVLEGMLKTLDAKLAPELREIRSIELKNASAARAASLIQQMMDARLERLRKVQPETADLERATVVADPRTNSIIIASGNDTFEVIKRLVADLDVNTISDSALVNVLSIPKSSNIDRVAQAINQIMERRWADMPPELQKSQRPLVLTDPRTSSLLISANPEDMSAIEQLVHKLADVPMNPAVGVNLVSLPPGTRAENIAPRLQRLMTERQQTLGTSNTPSDRVSIEPDLASNSLIVAASDENLEVIKGLIKALSDADVEAAGGGGREVELVTLRASRASDVVDMLGDLYVKEANRVRGANAVRIRTDERLNAIVINAPPGDVRALKDLIAQLDGAKPARVVEIKYIALQSANALETVSLIENVLSGRGIGARAGSRQATVLKYLREIAKAQATTEPAAEPEKPIAAEDSELPVEMEVSAAIRESITLTPDLRTNTIIVSAPRESIAMIERMIRDLDESTGGSKNIRIFKLVNADAIAMAQILTDLFRIKQGNNLFVLKPREEEPLAASRGTDVTLQTGDGTSVVGAPAPPETGGITGTELTAVPDERQQLAITVDSRTNSLIVSGTPTYLDLVDQVVKELDSLEANEREVYVYQLRNSVASEVAKVVGEFVAAEQQKLVSTLSADQLGSAARLLEREITIQGDTKSNTVLVSASPRYMTRVKEMIRQLDVDPPQVLIQVMLAEVTLDSTDEWGVNFNAMAKIGSTTVAGGYGLATAFVNGIGVPNISVTGSDFDLLIRAMKSQGRLQVLSNPSIMAANNAPARIQVGETVRLPTSTSVSDAGRTSSSLEKEDIGVILTVTPSINPDGFVRMDINPEISNLSNRTTQVSEEFESPIITRRTAETTVTVHDGQTIVIGGLISDRFERRDRKVPVLGDIPVVGILFRANTEELNKTELLIVLTPHVITSPAEFERVDQMTNDEIDRLSLPPDIKDQIRKSILEGTGGLYDSKGRRIDTPVSTND